MVLGGMLFVFVLYSYFTMLLGPLDAKKTGLIAQEAELQKKIEGANSKLRQLQNLEQAAKQSTEVYAVIQDLTPEGSPLAWVPVRLRDFFTRFGLEVAIRSSGSAGVRDPLLAKFIDTSWVVEVPSTDFVTLGNTIAAFENGHPLARFETVQVLASPDRPEFQRVSLSLTWRLYDKR